MPVDIRQVAFSPEEAMIAIVEFSRKRCLAIPTGTALGVNVQEEPEVTVAIAVQEGSGDKNEFRRSGANLAAVLSSFAWIERSHSRPILKRD